MKLSRFRMIRFAVTGAVLLFSLSLAGCGRPPVWNQPAWQKLFSESLSGAFPWPVQAEKISWGWQSGPQVVLDNLKISMNGEPVLEARKARAHISLRSLFAKKITVNTWSFENAVLQVSRSGERWNWHLPTMPARAHDAFHFDFSNVEFSDVQIHHKDVSAEPPFDISFTVSSARVKWPGGESPLQGHAVLKFKQTAQMPFQLGFTYTQSQDHLVFDLSSVDDRFDMDGEVDQFSAGFYSKFRLQVKRFDSRFLLPSYAGVRGLLTLSLEGSSQGTHPELLKRFLGLEGALDIREGTFSSRNLLVEVLDTLKPVTSVQALLDKDFKGLLSKDQTPFDILQISLNIAQGQLYIDSLMLKQASFLLEGEGKVGVNDGLMDLRARLVCLEDLSGWMVQQNNEFKALQNEQGRIVVPFLYRGLLPDLSPEADWDILGAVLNQIPVPQTAEAVNE